MTAKPIIVVSEHLSDAPARWLAERSDVRHVPYDAAEFPEAIRDAAGLVVRTYTNVDAALLAAAPKLRVIGRAGAGLDNIDIERCRARSIEVVYTPDANTQAVVEYVLCLIGDSLRPREVLQHALDRQAWNDLRARTTGKRQMSECTLGILGLGRVGRRLARVASAIGMRVLYHDLIEAEPADRAGAQPVDDPRTLFAESDIVSIHIDGRSSNRGFVDAHLIDGMREEVILINTSRGFVVDNRALARFLRTRPAARALLDVHEPEPFGGDYPLLVLPNALLYPHLASRTESAMNAMSWVVRDVLAVLEGRPPEFPAPGD